MSEQTKNKVVVIAAVILLLGFFVWCIFKPADDVSVSERRPLATMPEVTFEDILSGEFMEDFEEYTTDQFPEREFFRTVKALTSFYLMGQKDVEDVYVVDGYIEKLEYPLDIDSLDYAADRFLNVYNKYLDKESIDVYLSIIPDKNYFMAEQNGYPSMDYELMIEHLTGEIKYMKYIDIFSSLELSDYYYTDSHWRQESVGEVVDKLGQEMGFSVDGQYEINTLEKPFYGVYHGQAALPLPSEQLNYLTNDIIDSYTVFDYELNKEGPVYDMEKADSNDPYSMFLSGTKSLLKITNSSVNTDKKLIIFRDSFGSSIAPLLAQGYSETYVVDIRYITSDILGNFIDFENSDVLFLYCATVMNNSIMLK